MKNLAIAAGIVLAFSHVSSADAATLRGGGPLESNHWVVADDSVSTNLGTFEKVPSMNLSFDTARKGAIIAQYCANTFASGAKIIHVRVVLNGTVMFPGAVAFNAENPTFNESQCFTWIAKSQPAGSYRIRVQHRSNGAGLQVFANERSLVVRHR